MYRLAFNTNLLGLIVIRNPNLKVIQISGAGTIASKSIESHFEFGTISRKGFANIHLHWPPKGKKGEEQSASLNNPIRRHPLQIKEIFDACVSQGFGDVALTRIGIWKRLGFKTVPSYLTSVPLDVRLYFAPLTLHAHSFYQKFVVDGVTPYQKMYIKHQELKRIIKASLSEEHRRSVDRIMRSTVLLLSRVEPSIYQKHLDRYEVIESMREQGMIIIEENKIAGEFRDFTEH